MNWWHYLLLVNFYLVLFFGFYTLLLRKETFFQLNRIYLVAASLLSFFIPLIQSDWVKNLFITQQVQHTIYNSPVMEVYAFTPTVDVLTVGEILNVVYISVTLFLIIRLMWQLLILKKAIEKPEPSAAYSFFKKISLGKDLADRDVIHKHEQVHAKQWHSVDVMIIETVMIINWFNPVVYLYRFAIKYIHEYIADRQVIQSGTDKADYALLLLSQTFEVETHSLAIPFYNHSLLKKRIMMLQKNKSQRIALAKYGLSAPLFALMLIFSSATVSNSTAVKAINNKAENVFAKPATETITGITDNAEIPEQPAAEIVKSTLSKVVGIDTVPAVTKVENPPQFPGGLEGLGKFLGKTIRYPKVDKDNKVQGRVFVEFVVERNGSVSNIKALKAPSETLKAEAVRVMKLSPNWIPGYQNSKAVRVKFTIPINFTLGPDNGNANGDNKVFSSVEQSPSFPGGTQKFGEFLSKNIRYPKEMHDKGIQGRVYISFIVETDGTLSTIKVLKEPGFGSGEEAVRVMSMSPKWNPGIQDARPVRVQFTVPINFSLNKVTGAIPGPPDTVVMGYGYNNINYFKSMIDIRNVRIDRETTGSPLFIVDGVVKDRSVFEALDPNSIAGVSVIKDSSAKVYGEKAKNGVVLITTKAAKKL
jgi:TonB family protein